MNGRSKKYVICELLSFWVAEIPLGIAWLFNAEWVAILMLSLLIISEIFFMIHDLRLWKRKLIKFDFFCVIRLYIIFSSIWFLIKKCPL